MSGVSVPTGGRGLTPDPETHGVVGRALRLLAGCPLLAQAGRPLHGVAALEAGKCELGECEAQPADAQVPTLDPMVRLSTSGVSHEVTVATRVLVLVMVRAGTDDGHVVSHEGFAVAVAADVGIPDGTDSLDPDPGASDVGPVAVARQEHGVVGLAVTQAQRADTDWRTWAPPAIPQPDMTQPRATFWITADELQAQASSPCSHFAADSAADSMHGVGALLARRARTARCAAGRSERRGRRLGRLAWRQCRGLGRRQ